MIDTTGPFLAAYIVTALVLAAYTASVWSRARRLRERLDESRRAPAESERRPR